MPPEKLKYNLDIGKILAVLISGAGICITIGVCVGTMQQRLTNVETDIHDIKEYIYPRSYQAELNHARAMKNRYAPVKTVDE